MQRRLLAATGTLVFAQLLAGCGAHGPPMIPQKPPMGPCDGAKDDQSEIKCLQLAAADGEAANPGITAAVTKCANDVQCARSKFFDINHQELGKKVRAEHPELFKNGGGAPK
jgi:hypothetical protein